MSLIQHRTQKVFWLLLLLSLPGFINAQEELPDSLPRLDQPVIDTESIQPPPPQEYDDMEEMDTSFTTTRLNLYFVPKNRQENGGGPASLQPVKVPDTIVARYKADNDFWYINYVFDKTKEKQYNKSETEKPFTSSPAFQTFLWILAIGSFAAFVIMYLSNSNVRLFRSKDSVIRSDEEMEAATENIFEINYQREIDRAVAAGNYRFAVRLMFLRVLKTLADKQVINYTADRTNFDYLLQLNGTKHYRSFFTLTRDYEYTWYGHFPVDAERFGLIRKDFDNFNQSVGT